MDALNDLFGIYHQRLLLVHMIWRVLVVYLLGIILIRVNRRFMTLRTSNNFFLFIFIGSILATSLIGPFFYEVLGMVLFIMFVNWLVVVTGYHFRWFKRIVEGKPALLIDNGRVQRKTLNRYFITEEELIEFCRIRTNVADLTKVEKAYFERNGEISFIIKE
jgi:uncharacterized membrane protein YcaP (DUF421 family)